MSNRHSVFYARCTDGQYDALDKAIAAHERRTGLHLKQADVVRAGVAQFVRSEGEAFPPFEPVGTPNRDRMHKRRASSR